MKILNKFKISNNLPEEFEELLRKEVIESEKLKAKIFSIIAIIMFFLQVVVLTFFYNQVYDVFQSLIPFFIMVGFTVLIFIRETQIIRLLNNRIKENKVLNKKMQYINIIAEASIPSVILTGMLIFNFSYEVLSSPIILIYFLIITLSVLGLEFWVTLTAGLVAAVEYLIISAVVLEFSEIPENVNLLDETFIHVIKSAILLMAGTVGGIVGHMIKRRIVKTFKLTSEKNNLINTLGQQVSRDIAQELIDNDRDLSAKELFAAVLFLDIRGFTPLVSKLRPEEIIKYQNQIFGFMIEHISKHNGLINQFLGDGYMATFGAPVSRGNVCQNAVNAALGIIKELEEINSRNEIPFTRIGIGIHAGDIVAGNVGTDIRKQYSVSGNTVILASRIEQLTKTFESQLLVSREVIDNLDDKQELFISLGEISVKGRSEPIEILKPI